MLKSFAVMAGCLAMAACVRGQVGYVAPAPVDSKPAAIAISMPRADVWKAAIPKLGQTFFVINNLDQSSGLINVSYSGDPEAFVDCGRITSSVEDANGKRDYDFPGARAHSVYDAREGATIFSVERSMKLDGRANLILEEVSPTNTRVSVNVRYDVTRSVISRPQLTLISHIGTVGASSVNSIQFNSGFRAAFAPAAGQSVGTTCQSSGTLERQLLAIFTTK